MYYLLVMVVCLGIESEELVISKSKFVIQIRGCFWYGVVVSGKFKF